MKEDKWIYPLHDRGEQMIFGARQPLQRTRFVVKKC